MPHESIIVAYTDVHDLCDTEKASLSQGELERAAQFKAESRQREFLCARALLRATLQRYTGMPAASHELVIDENGKPLCVDGPAVSIAHSGNLVVCAVSDRGAIGIDVEIPDGPRDVAGIANRYFAEDEAAWLANQPADRFYMLWVLKEAWLKAVGTGIAGGLDRIRCFVAPPVIDVQVTDGELPALNLIALHDALVGVATTAGSPSAGHIYRWEPDTPRFTADDRARLIAATA